MNTRSLLAKQQRLLQFAYMRPPRLTRDYEGPSASDLEEIPSTPPAYRADPKSSDYSGNATLAVGTKTSLQDCNMAVLDSEAGCNFVKDNSLLFNPRSFDTVLQLPILKSMLLKLD